MSFNSNTNIFHLVNPRHEIYINNKTITYLLSIEADKRLLSSALLKYNR